VYHHCIFCSAKLGANDVVEEFPVGRTLAFDAARGRLWAVCPTCRRWNLAPIEERWEAIETAEKLFRGSRLRVHSENVGMAKLADGTRLVRVGEALPGEFASWRYGKQMAARRWQHIVAVGAGALGMSALYIGAPSLLLLAPIGAIQYFRWVERASGEWVIGRVSAAEAGGRELVVRGWHLPHMTLALEADGRSLRLDLHDPDQRTSGKLTWKPRPRNVVLPDPIARAVLRHAMIALNRNGASTKALNGALDLIDQAGGANAYLYGQAARRDVLPPASTLLEMAPSLAAPPYSVALEIALNQEEERRAMDGELAMLQAAWREAESIAAIADVLPDEPPETA